MGLNIDVNRPKGKAVLRKWADQMLPQPIQYRLPDDRDLDQLIADLAKSNRLLEAETLRLKQTYLDSFDWLIWQAGAELQFENSRRGNRLCWVKQNSLEPPLCVALDKLPGFPSELPAGVLRERIARALQSRKLLPIVHVQQQLQTLKVVNKDDKTVLRLILQASEFSSPDGKQSGPLGARVVLKPLKGYQKALKRMQLEFDALGLHPVTQSLYESAVAGIGRAPGDYSSKLNYQLNPQARSDATAKQIMLSLLNTLEANIDGTKANLDSEFLHDLRVATRRTRSAMSQIKGVFDERELEPFKKGFAWLGQVTGPTRDMDVYLLKFDHYRHSLPAKIRPDLDPFHDFLVTQHKRAQALLVRKLNSPQFRELIKTWREWLEQSVADTSLAPNATRPIAELADQRIFKIYKRVLKQGRAIEPDSPAELLHDLRKDCKKLRYLMEYFQSLYPKQDTAALIKLIKVLLDNLGDFQDLQVQAEAIESFAEKMQEQGAPASALMAMGILVGDLLERQQQARDEFAALFSEFNNENNTQAFDKLFGLKTNS
ncbi:MAG: CHAD domain-containing protein [Gammaproteobacteria bacterium]|jgi:CHAD domain-containing protein